MRTMLHQSIERLQATYDAIDRLDTKQEESKQSIDATKEAVKDLKERSGGGGNAHTGPD
jgi:prefoldin subunit 5